MVPAMDPVIRPATRDDLPFLAWVQQEASRSHLPFGFWDIAFPGPDEYRLGLIEAVCGTAARSFCHWSGFLIAEVGGEPAAGLSAYDQASLATGPCFMKALGEATAAEGWNEARLQAMFERLGPFLTCAPEQPDDAWIVEWVATRPEHRGKGLVRALLPAVVDLGRRRGHRRFQIGVLIGNTPAQRAYEGAGFVVVDEKRHPAFEATFGSPGIRRLMRD
jgi:ribosomal protein S18 acetylase RimI-like enzyme